MFKAFEFCMPSTGTKIPDGLDWLHEIKYDGYRLRLERDGARVRLISRRATTGQKRIDGSWSPPASSGNG
jgi:ATP-dependent DNA ligase